MPAGLTDDQKEIALIWCRNHRCCLILPYGLVVNGEKPEEVRRCKGRCPVTGQTGGKRDLHAIYDLMQRLGLHVEHKS
jgi:hypothetical protein